MKTSLKFITINGQKFLKKELNKHDQEMQRLHDIGHNQQIKDFERKIY